jgi:hypothetical protein
MGYAAITNYARGSPSAAADMAFLSPLFLASFCLNGINCPKAMPVVILIIRVSAGDTMGW